MEQKILNLIRLKINLEFLSDSEIVEIKDYIVLELDKIKNDNTNKDIDCDYFLLLNDFFKDIEENQKIRANNK